MRLDSKSFFDIIKDAKTCKFFFYKFSELPEYPMFRLDEPVRVIFHEISMHCPAYRSILDRELYIRVHNRAVLSLYESDRLELISAMARSSGLELEWLNIFRSVCLGEFTSGFNRGDIFARMLAAIDRQALDLGVDVAEFRADILPHLKLAIAYSESE